MKQFTPLLINFFRVFCASMLVLSCAGSDQDIPGEKRLLLEKVFMDDALYLEIFYDEQYSIRRIDSYLDGMKKSQREIALDAKGRVKSVVMDFGHYTATRTLTYDGEKKVSDVTLYEFADGTPSRSIRREWRYPKEHVIEDLLYSDSHPDIVSYLHRHTFSETGKLLKVERRVIGRPVQDSYTTYQHDQGISYEYMIERNIPGYAEMPVSGNQPVSAKRYKPSGELISESIYHNRYNSEGYLESYRVETGSTSQSFRLQYVKAE
ncbi:MAG: hypothetical protein PHS71_07780 [Proteiniphilum sp.]|jgi:hypothetical protein|nr:hypothetical protein [Proteiniphilum sp.]MDD2513131.1 hypothetical protein [Proteiniphilum sp.]